MSNLSVLFDVNASFGKPSSGGTDFPAIQDRLDAMDRLGISRSLVWSLDSRQNRVLASNTVLIEGILKTPGAAGRIFPALAVSSLIPYEHDGLALMEQQLNALPCRALHFTAGMVRLTLMQLEPVIQRIRTLRPFIILNRDEASVADILEFTALFPDIPLVLTEITWGSCNIVFDLMRRRQNILMESSWLHTFNAVELVVKHFGAERLLFGTGYKSHNGAAMGALARANITAEQRHLIASGNLDRLTGLNTVPVKAASCWTANTLWPRFLEGNPLGVDVVDAHGHLGPSGGYMLEAQDERQQIEAGVKVMDAIGIRTLMVSGMQALFGGGPVEGNDLLETLLRPHADRISGYVVFNPFYADELVPKFDAYFAGPVYKGFKTLCSYWKVPITDQRFIPMWTYANQHHLPVLSHTWGGDGFDSPVQFEDLVKEYPNVPFILGHAGGVDKGRLEAEELAQKYPNVYLEWCGSFCSTMCWEKTLKIVDPKQVVFGTDAMAHDFNWELGRLLSLEVTDQVLIAILGGNMRRILALRKHI